MPTPQSPRVFISYARKDGEEFATQLRQRLERDEPEITLWQDRARMEGGKDWWNQILEALDHVQFMVLIMTPASQQSAMVRKEWETFTNYLKSPCRAPRVPFMADDLPDKYVDRLQILATLRGLLGGENPAPGTVRRKAVCKVQ